MKNFNTRLEEFKALNSKRDLSKGYMQGLTLNEYNRINSLHAFLISSEEGKKEVLEINN